MSKKNKVEVEDAEFEEVFDDIEFEEDELNTSEEDFKFLLGNFCKCLNSITKIPLERWESCIEKVNMDDSLEWYKPFTKLLNEKKYDIVYFAYDTGIPIDNTAMLERYDFSSSPSGKCIILGKSKTPDGSKNQFKVLCGRNIRGRCLVVYDPDPENVLIELNQMGFFIDMEPFAEKDNEAE